MLLGDVQEFELNFIPCILNEIEDLIYGDNKISILNKNGLSKDTLWIDIYKLLETYDKFYDQGLIYLNNLNEMITIFQSIESKFEYVKNKVDLIESLNILI